jgi:hypothetical protein
LGACVKGAIQDVFTNAGGHGSQQGAGSGHIDIAEAGQGEIGGLIEISPDFGIASNIAVL